MRLHLLTIIAILFFSVAQAGTRLTLEADTTVFSGPSLKFRPLQTGRAGDSYAVSPRQVTSDDGIEFYKVLIKKKNAPIRVGYIPVDAEVRIAKSEESEDVDSYKSFSQADTALQVGFQAIKDSNFIWTIGWQKYPAENFYLKVLVGQLLSERSGSLLTGVEVGTDQPMFDQFSLYALFAGGNVLLAEANMIFPGSKQLTFFAQGGTGIRYTADEKAAVSFGVFQMALISPNNSFLSLGAGMTLEVGL